MRRKWGPQNLPDTCKDVQSVPGMPSYFIGNHGSWYNWTTRKTNGGQIKRIVQFPAGCRLYFCDGSSCLEQDLSYSIVAKKVVG